MPPKADQQSDSQYGTYINRYRITAAPGLAQPQLMEVLGAKEQLTADKQQPLLLHGQKQRIKTPDLVVWGTRRLLRKERVPSDRASNQEPGITPAPIRLLDFFEVDFRRYVVRRARSRSQEQCKVRTRRSRRQNHTLIWGVNTFVRNND